MAEYEVLRTVHGPYGSVELSRKSKVLGGWAFCVHHTKTGKSLFYGDYDDAMRKAIELSGGDPATYQPGE